MPVSRILVLASFGAALIGLLAVGQPASAQVRPQVTAGSGLVVATFALPEGAVTRTCGTTWHRARRSLEGSGSRRLRADFRRSARANWRAVLLDRAHGEPRQLLLITLLDRQGSERSRAWLQTGTAAQRDAAFRFPPLVQAGKPLPIRGPLDGDFRTTRVVINGSAVSPLTESVRRVIVRAPSDLIGPTSSTLTEAGVEHRGAMPAVDRDGGSCGRRAAGHPRSDGEGCERD